MTREGDTVEEPQDNENSTMRNYRYASKVRVTPALDEHDGVWIFAGKVEDGAEMVRETDGEQEWVTLELLERFHSDERMTKEQAVKFGKQQDDDERWSNEDSNDKM